MRRLALFLLSLSLLVGCETINQIFAMWGSNNRVVDRAMESPNESIQAEAAEVRQRSNHYLGDTGFRAD